MLTDVKGFLSVLVAILLTPGFPSVILSLLAAVDSSVKPH